MPVDLGAILSRSFQLTFSWRNRVLWLLGLIVALLAAQPNVSGAFFRPPTGAFSPGSGPSTNPFSGSDFSTLIGEIVAGTAVSLLIALIFLLLRPSFEAGLIAAADTTAQSGPPAFNTAWARGRARMWPVLGLDLFLTVLGWLLIALALLPVLLAGGAFVTWLISVAAQPGVTPSAPPSDAVTALGASAIFVCCLGLVGLLLWIAAWFVVQIAQRAAVLDGQGAGKALATGWRLLRANFGPALVIGIVQAALTWLAGVIGGIIIGLIVALPTLGLTFNSLQNGSTGSDATYQVVTLISGVVSWLLLALVMAVPTAWGFVLWTLFYRAVTVGLPQPAPTGAYAGPLPPPPMPYGGYPAPGAYGPPAPGAYPDPNQAALYPGVVPPGPTAPGPANPYGTPPPPGGYTVPGQYPAGYGPAAAPGGYTVPGQYPAGYGPPPPPGTPPPAPPNPYGPPPAPGKEQGEPESR